MEGRAGWRWDAMKSSTGVKWMNPLPSIVTQSNADLHWMGFLAENEWSMNWWLPVEKKTGSSSLAEYFTFSSHSLVVRTTNGGLLEDLAYRMRSFSAALCRHHAVLRSAEEACWHRCLHFLPQRALQPVRRGQVLILFSEAHRLVCGVFSNDTVVHLTQ